MRRHYTTLFFCKAKWLIFGDGIISQQTEIALLFRVIAWRI